MTPPESDLAAVVLAGGSARRLGGAIKPLLPVGGRPLLTRVLCAAAVAGHRIVVGPPALAPLLPAGVRLTRELPPGGGPVAALAAGVRLLPDEVDRVAVLSADLPFLTPTVLCGLTWSMGDLSVLVDGSGRPQWLCALWRRAVLGRRLAALGDPAGARMRDLAEGIAVHTLVLPQDDGPPPWWDCDTAEDLRRAQEWVR